MILVYFTVDTMDIFLLFFFFFVFVCEYICLFFKDLFVNLFLAVLSLLLHTGFLELWQADATFHWGAWASHCSGFSCSMGSRYVAFSRCTWVQ